MTFVSYAQNFEDVLLWRALSDVDVGCYLDIGAQDPVVDSVSLAFYKAGWRGIHVEPTPAYAGLLRDARPDETVIQAAVTDAVGPLEFFEFPLTGLSTGDPDIARRHGELGLTQKSIVVPTVRLDQLFDLVEDNHLHWLKIDVEGMEEEVLRSWGEHPRRPWILVIEATSPNTQVPTHTPWIGEVTKRDYEEAYFDGLSRYFVHIDHIGLKERMKTPPNIFDGFQLSSGHFGVQEIIHEAQRNQEAAAAVAEAARGALIEEIAAVRVEAADMSRQKEMVERRVAGLDAQLASAAADAKAAETARIGSLETLATATADHAAAIDALWRERQQHEQALRETWSAREAELDAGRAKQELVHRSEVEALRKRIETDRERSTAVVAALQGQLGDRQRDVSAATAQLRVAELRLSAERDKSSERARRLTKAEAGRRQLDHRLLQAELEVAAQAERLAAAQRASDLLGKSLSEAQAQLGAKDRELVEVWAERAQIVQSLSRAEGKLEEQARLVAAAQSGREQADQALAQAGSELETQKRLAADAASERAQLDAGLAEARRERAVMHRAAKEALAQPRGLWHRLGRSLGLAHDELARQALSAWCADQPILQPPAPELMMHSFSPDHGPNPCHRASSLDELLAWHDVDFVRCAYVTVLGRQPDPEGEAYYTRRVRRGVQKLLILRQMRRSEEGRDFDPGIKSLDAELAKAWRARWPAVGVFLPDSDIEPQRGGKRLVRSLVNQVGAIDQQMKALTNQVADIGRNIERPSQPAPVPGQIVARATEFPSLVTIENILTAFEKPTHG